MKSLVSLTLNYYAKQDNTYGKPKGYGKDKAVVKTFSDTSSTMTSAFCCCQPIQMPKKTECSVACITVNE